MPSHQHPPWLRGPIDGIVATLQPVAHALIDADEDVEKGLAKLSAEQFRTSLNGAASAGFHVKHAMGSLDRLFTYARGEPLSESQMTALEAEKPMDVSAMTPEALALEFSAAITRALDQLRRTRESDLHLVREVGRAKLPATTLGLLFHAAEHTQRHVGQLMTTVKVLTGA